MPTMARRSSWVAARTLTALVAFAITPRSLHVNPFRGHFDYHPPLVRTVALELPARVQASKLVDVLVRAFHDQLGSATDRHYVSIWPRGIEHRDGDAVVSLQVASLQARKCSIEIDVVAVGLD